MTTNSNDVGSMGQFIPVGEARAMTARYRTEKDNILKPQYQKLGILPVCESFSRKIFDALLQSEGCVGLRVYLGMDENLLVRVILTAFNEDFQDILPEFGSAAVNTLTESPPNGGTVEDGARCPDICPNPPL